MMWGSSSWRGSSEKLCRDICEITRSATCQTHYIARELSGSYVRMSAYCENNGWKLSDISRGKPYKHITQLCAPEHRGSLCLIQWTLYHISGDNKSPTILLVLLTFRDFISWLDFPWPLWKISNQTNIGKEKYGASRKRQNLHYIF